MSGFHPASPWTDQISGKRVNFLHCVTQQLCQVTYLPEVSMDAVATAISNLLSEIEAVESTSENLNLFIPLHYKHHVF